MHEEFGIPKTKDEKIEHIVHLYMDGAYDRREVLRRLARYTGGLAGAGTVLTSRGLAQSSSACAEDVRVPFDAPDITVDDIMFPGKAGGIFAQLAKPNPLEKALPAVIVIHENQGLLEHHKDVARRVARAGFIGLGIDLLSRQGGTHVFAANERAMAYGRTVTSERMEDLQSAIDYLNSEGFVEKGKIGAVGFCAGGGNIFSLIFTTRDLVAAVPFYGTPPNPLPPIDAIGEINTKLLMIFSETDRNQNARIPELLGGLVARQKTFGLHLYQGSAHGFHNDTGNVYNRAAACDAWNKTIDFFRTHLR